MPELPEVETTRRGLATRLEGQCIEKVIIRETRLRWPVASTLSFILPNQQILRFHRRGKYLLFECTEGYLLVHLGMSGSLRVLNSDTPLKKHDHIDILFPHDLCLRYHDPRRFGCLLWVTEPLSHHFLLKHLGLEPLETAFTGQYLYHLAQNRRIAVKNYIMNSRIVVGVGNIYANEALFLAQIDPRRPANLIHLTHYQNLVEKIQYVLNAAIEKGGTTLRDFTDTTGHFGDFKPTLQVYDRAGLPCKVCRNKIMKQYIGKRATYFCPVCQL